MPAPTRLVRHAGAMALATLLVAACGATASPSPSAAGTPAPTASPSAEATATVTATPEATPTATPEPTATPDQTSSTEPSASAVDPTAELEIGEPYALEPLDEATAAAFEAGIGEGLGAMAEVIDLGAMTVTRDGEQVAILLAMAFRDFPGTEDPTFFESVMGGVAGSSGGEVQTTTIGGKTVGLVEGPDTAFAGYQQDSTVIFAIGPSLDEATEVVTALIEANP